VKKYNNVQLETEDLISVGCIGLIKAISAYKMNKGTQLATFAAKCIDNEILMFIRANKKNANNTSLHEAVGMDREGNEITLLDVLFSNEESVPDSVESALTKEKLLRIIKEVLDEREYIIVTNRFGLLTEYALTQREIAKKLGISRSYISRIEKRALEKIEAHLRQNPF
jgi:RNA polymerase sporulation-specific sigma factor